MSPLDSRFFYLEHFFHINNIMNQNILKKRLFLTAIFAVLFISKTLFAVSVFEEKVVVHANRTWEATEIVTQENFVLSWNVSDDDLWTFNKDIFPEGHSANGIEGIPALYGYVYPVEDIGKLIGRIGDYGKKFPMGTSGEIIVKGGEGGEYLYMTMNDETSQIYGKGFRDNEGQIIVTIIQKPLNIAIEEQNDKSPKQD